jgi:hypothetical protein
MASKAKLLATMGRGAEATEVLLATPAITGANRTLIQALIYKADNKLGNGKEISFSVRTFFIFEMLGILVTLMQIRMPLFTLMRIRIQLF